MKQYKKPRIKTKSVKLNHFLINGNQDAIAMNILAATIIGPNCCFLKGTKVLMDDGGQKELDKIATGDIVKSYSTSSGKFSSSKVEKLITKQMGEKGYIIINGKIKVTCHHLMFANGAWKSAESLKVGDVLLDSSGKKVKVSSLKSVVGEKHTVYNLRLSGRQHNYFAEGILVHNTNKRMGNLIAQC